LSFILKVFERLTKRKIYHQASFLNQKTSIKLEQKPKVRLTAEEQLEWMQQKSHDGMLALPTKVKVRPDGTESRKFGDRGNLDINLDPDSEE
jgi:hypothetical protein